MPRTQKNCVKKKKKDNYAQLRENGIKFQLCARHWAGQSQETRIKEDIALGPHVPLA